MERAERTFWGIVAIAGLYVFASFSFNLGTKANAEQQSAPSQQVAAAQPAAKGMSCGSGGGGCGCGAMRKAQ